MKAKILGLVLGCLAIAGQASASVIYTYTGNDFTSATGDFTTNDNLTLTFTVPDVLTASNLPFVPDEWSVTAGSFVVDSGSISVILHSLNADNTPSVACFSGSSAGVYFAASIAQAPGHMLVVTACHTTTSVGDLFIAGESTGANVSTPGSWSIRQAPTGSVPEPASLALLGMGLVTMGGRAWRRRRAVR